MISIRLRAFWFYSCIHVSMKKKVKLKYLFWCDKMTSAKDFVRDTLRKNPHFKNINMVNSISTMRRNKGDKNKRCRQRSDKKKKIISENKGSCSWVLLEYSANMTEGKFIRNMLHAKENLSRHTTFLPFISWGQNFPQGSNNVNWI